MTSFVTGARSSFPATEFSIGNPLEYRHRVFIATMAISIQDMPPEQRKMVESMANPDIDPEAHEATQRGMNEMASKMREMLAAADHASPEDIETVRPHVDQFRALGDE